MLKPDLDMALLLVQKLPKPLASILRWGDVRAAAASVLAGSKTLDDGVEELRVLALEEYSAEFKSSVAAGLAEKNTRRAAAGGA